MTPKLLRRRFAWLPILASSLAGYAAAPATAPSAITAEFHRLCDLAAPELLLAGRDTPFYAEAYAVRALAPRALRRAPVHESTGE